MCRESGMTIESMCKEIRVLTKGFVGAGPMEITSIFKSSYLIF
jgi:uncharacterized protein YbcI